VTEPDQRKSGDLASRRDPVEAGQRRVLRNHQHVRVAEELDTLEWTVGERVDGERQIEIARLHEIEQAVVAVSLHQAHLDLRPRRREDAQCGRQDPSPDALIGAHPEHARRTLRIRPEVRACRLHSGHDRVDVAKKKRPRLRQLDGSLAPRAVEQPHPEQSLESGHVLADCGLGVFERVRRFVERAGLGHGAEAQQVTEFDVGQVISRHNR
jgi:hypothetical protein